MKETQHSTLPEEAAAQYVYIGVGEWVGVHFFHTSHAWIKYLAHCHTYIKGINDSHVDVQQISCLRRARNFTEQNVTSMSLTLILRRSRTGTVWFYTSTTNKSAARPKLYTKSLTRDLKLMY